VMGASGTNRMHTYRGWRDRMFAELDRLRLAEGLEDAEIAISGRLCFDCGGSKPRAPHRLQLRSAGNLVSARDHITGDTSRYGSDVQSRLVLVTETGQLGQVVSYAGPRRRPVPCKANLGRRSPTSLLRLPPS
jgi:hypothetical protein